MKRNELVEELDRTLNVAAFPGDASNNGLQIEGAPEVKRILFGVDGCLALFEHARRRTFRFCLRSSRYFLGRGTAPFHRHSRRTGSGSCSETISACTGYTCRSMPIRSSATMRGWQSWPN